MNEKTNYDQLIYSWYEKASGEDYFSKFVFLELSFVALLRKRFFVFSKDDRDAIESLKKAEKIKKTYLEFLKEDNRIKSIFEALVIELNESPLKNVSKNNGKIKEIKIINIEDWINLIEFIYVVRNNLFHGEKNPESSRDSKMVYYAYTLLEPLVRILIAYGASNLEIDDYDLKRVKEMIERIKNETTNK